MRSARLLSCAVLSFLFVVSASAKTPRENATKITVVVPFDFMVERTMFPAGKYVITKTGDYSFRLRAQRGIESATFSAGLSQTPSYAHTPSLNFAEENRHFQLRQLWITSRFGLDISRQTTPQLFAVRASHIEVQAVCSNCE